VGEILRADPIEGADKLAELEVDIGVETRQIVAGIKELHDLEALPGTRIVIVANLEKKRAVRRRIERNVARRGRGGRPVDYPRGRRTGDEGTVTDADSRSLRGGHPA